jgi:hypothetical protein
MKTKGVRVTKTGRALLLVGSNTPHERDRQIEAVCKSVDATLSGIETTLHTDGHRYASSPPLTPETFERGLRLLKHDMENPRPPRTELLSPQQMRDRETALAECGGSCFPICGACQALAFAAADDVLATMNFKGVKNRAMAPCSCATPKDRTCASCLARDTILRSRGDYR